MAEEEAWRNAIACSRGPNTILVIHIRGKDGETTEEGEATWRRMDSVMKKTLDSQDFVQGRKKTEAENALFHLRFGLIFFFCLME